MHPVIPGGSRYPSLGEHLVNGSGQPRPGIQSFLVAVSEQEVIERVEMRALTGRQLPLVALPHGDHQRPGVRSEHLDRSDPRTLLHVRYLRLERRVRQPSRLVGLEYRLRASGYLQTTEDR